MRRHFNSSERVALYLASSGVCSLCGVRLEPGWHADHVHPWSIGGPTDVINGQALCPACNLKKGKSVKQKWKSPDDVKLRGWHKRGYRKYLLHRKQVFTLVGTPGCGKTRFALFAMLNHLIDGSARKTVIVVPSEHLKIQWAEAAHAMGINLDPWFQNGHACYSKDYDGVCVTYAQVAMNMALFRNMIDGSTLVILDEIHHAGDQETWGKSIEFATLQAFRIIAMSGTMFRTESAITVVEYDVLGVLKVDFEYTYSQALDDTVCRPVLFPSYEGDFQWYWRGQSYQSTFRDDLARGDASRRMRTALDPRGDWLPKVLREANEKLTVVRETHRDAAGLVVAIDVNHANAIGELLLKITGERPAVITVEDTAASESIKEFAGSYRRWVVAIKMVSEGVDIPRLRVGVYASNVQTEMFFRQFVGRFVRVMEGLDDQNAFVYIPRDPVLFGFALAIAEMRVHQLLKEIAEAAERAAGVDDRPEHSDDKIRTFIAVSSTGRPDDVVFDRESISQAEIREAEAFRQDIGAPPSWDAAIVAKLVRKARGTIDVEVKAEVRVSDPESRPLHEQKDQLRKLIKRSVAQLVEISNGTLEYDRIYAKLTERDGARQPQATIDQLNARLEYLQKWIQGYPDAR